MASSITINGKTYTSKRSGNISIKNGRVIVDGVDQTPEDEKKINILIEGSIAVLEVDHAERVGVSGAVGSVRTMSGDVEIAGDVNSDVKTQSGNVKLDGSIKGNVKTMSGDVKAKGGITGKVNTMSGNITK